MNLVNDSIKAKLKDRLSDIGPCINGPAHAYTAKKGVFETFGLNAAIDVIEDQEKLEEFIVSVIDGMVRKGLGIKNSMQIVFRALEVIRKDDMYCFYVRSVIESSLLPDVCDIDCRLVNVI